jgi:hypothetical protein
VAAAPGLWRLARALRRLAILWFVVVAVFLASVAYSGSQLRPENESGPNTPPTVSGNDTITLTGSLNVSNGGWYPLTNVELFTEVDNPNGTILASGGSPVVTISAGGTTQVPFTITLALDSRAAARDLLTQDATLPSITWANATYADLFHVQVVVPQNVTWGAPLFGLNVSAGTPVAESNGTAGVPLTITFADHASFPVDGRAVYTLRSGGAVCTTGGLPVAVGSGQSFDGTTTAYLGPGCAASGATLSLKFLGAGWALSPFPVVIR